MESRILKKKRTMGRRMPKSFFRILPTDLQSKIFSKLSLKDQSNAMCVSPQWRDLILNTTLPKMHPHIPFVTAHDLPNPFIDLEQLFNWCSLAMHCEADPKNLISSSNGLLLFCHNKGEAANIMRDVYYYYVMNRVTKQCMAILKPIGQISGGYSYAALAYDPSESWFFKIVRFQGHRHINIFSSMTGLWTTLTICLPQYINESKWVQNSVYLKGSIYRLSCSGHLVRIKVDPQENISKQAEVITLHPDCFLNNCQWQICSENNKLLLVLSRGMFFNVFELIECVTNNVSSYTWNIVFEIESEELMPLNFYGKLLSFHPYHEVAFFKRGTQLYVYFTEPNLSYTTIDIEVGEVQYNKLAYDYIKHCGQPLLDCIAPFACTLEKKGCKAL
ncbi:F-box protein [Trifolium pratense]|uniref:F-box protein n=1 Tax=Trifolium pratense TaxID=57577 RepID=A0A2K3MZW3_TRIPR|nr:uncharacterized protein LOC123915387 [Trifolium pratense]PNX96314.1 F-box protein [Trifolium pratense]